MDARLEITIELKSGIFTAYKDVVVPCRLMPGEYIFFRDHDLSATCKSVNLWECDDSTWRVYMLLTLDSPSLSDNVESIAALTEVLESEGWAVSYRLRPHRVTTPARA